MSAIRVIAAGAVSPVGLGAHLHSVGSTAGPTPSHIRRDEALAAAGLRRPNAARAPRDVGHEAAGGDRAAALLATALRELCIKLDGQQPGWRRARVGVALGTSSGGMLTAERLFTAWGNGEAASPEVLSGATYFAPFCEALGAVGIDVGDGRGPPSQGGVTSPDGDRREPVVTPTRSTQVLAACASSTLAIGLGMRWLQREACDLVLAGGYDALSLFVAAGFEAIRATTSSRPRPFRLGRDGMALGEGACVLALARAGSGIEAPSLGYLVGFGAADEAVHITAPDRTGAGLARAAAAAVADAGVDSEHIDLVSAHGTATPYNDAMEARAIAAACRGSEPPIVHPYKAEVGHTLGAAGSLELLVALAALEGQLAPAACGDGELDPDAWVSLLERSEPRPLRTALKLSAAFGGVTAALVARRELPDEVLAPQRPRPARVVHVAGVSSVTEVDRARLAAAIGMARDRLARIDDLGQLCVAAVAALSEEMGRDRLQEAGVVLGHSLATLDINQRFFGRLNAKGPRYVDPRLFPGTSPNAAAGHCAIAFGLTGPNFAVGSGLGGSLEALQAAAELVAAGDAESMIVLAADDLGPAARRWLDEAGLGDRPAQRGAAAMLLSHRSPPPGKGWRLDGAPWRLLDDQRERHERGPIGHLALLDWAERCRPTSL